MAQPVLNIGMNVAEMPWGLMRKLCVNLNAGDQWKLMITGLNGSEAYKWEEVQGFARHTNPSEFVLRDLGNRGYCIKDLLTLLDRTQIEAPQLLLRRKFQHVRISRQPRCTKTDDDRSLVLECDALGFPYPSFQWRVDGTNIPAATSRSLVLNRCPNCVTVGSYDCLICNQVPEDDQWSHYRRPGKQFSSQVFSASVTIESSDLEGVCESCSKERALARLCQMVTDQTDLSLASASTMSVAPDDDNNRCTATDKVALIVCNCEYIRLPKLRTPPCDAESLAEALLSLGFKTVALADLTLAEMKSTIEEYRKLLGAGVYAVFYFVGHGLDTQGQCFLLPVDAPGTDYTAADCLSVDWVLARMQQQDPALNLILLDMCRKYPPSNLQDFLAKQEHTEYRVNRNTVFGYATSFGVGAYEVKGQTNGVFMTYLKNHITSPKPIIDVLNSVLADLEKDPKAGAVQFPELRTNLSRPRSLTDQMLFAGHTMSFDQRTSHWEHLHELPEPVVVNFDSVCIRVTIWLDFCGHFTNMVYVFSSVSDISGGTTESSHFTPLAHKHRAYLTFPQSLELSNTLVCSDHDEGTSIRYLLKNLQKIKGEVQCEVKLCEMSEDKVLDSKNVGLGHILITRL